MLVQFTVENFLSFSEETNFSMVASSDDKHPAHVVDRGIETGSRVLRAAAIYGSNAAGKSNLLKAVQWAQQRIVNGTRAKQPIPVRPFRLSAYAKEPRPSRFQFQFWARDVLYEYGFTLDRERIHQEWLFGLRGQRWAQERKYFQRTTSESLSTVVEPGTALVGRSKEKRQRLKFVEEGTRPNQLFLTEAIERNVSELEPVWRWFNDVLLVLPAEARPMALPHRVHRDEDFRNRCAEFLRAAGTGISGVSVREEPVRLESHLSGVWKGLTEESRQRFQDKIDSLEDDALLLVEGPGEQRVILRSDRGEPKILTLLLNHDTEDGRSVPFPVEDESEGTQRLIHLLPLVLAFGRKTERVVLLDELDRRFHTLLSRAFVQSMLGTESNYTQFIFTTHDTNLLDLDFLRRDEIWFVEKDRRGASHLYSLAQFRVRPELKIEKGYLQGRFGAIPFTGDPGKLGWLANGATTGEDCDLTEDATAATV